MHAPQTLEDPSGLERDCSCVDFDFLMWPMYVCALGERGGVETCNYLSTAEPSSDSNLPNTHLLVRFVSRELSRLQLSEEIVRS
jgi:hypothetical protein